MKTAQSASDLLQAYLKAISTGDVDAIEALIDDRALVEIPFLKPSRLIGKTEIQKGHREIRASLESIEFKALHIEANDTQAIAEGSLDFSRDGGEARHIETAVVAEARGGSLQRFSIYCDARHIRQWSDKTIL